MSEQLPQYQPETPEATRSWAGDVLRTGSIDHEYIEALRTRRVINQQVRTTADFETLIDEFDELCAQALHISEQRAFNGLHHLNQSIHEHGGVTVVQLKDGEKYDAVITEFAMNEHGVLDPVVDGEVQGRKYFSLKSPEEYDG